MKPLSLKRILLLERFGYTAANPLGVRLAWLAVGVLALLGAVAFVGYRLGDTPEETRRNLGMAHSAISPGSEEFHG